MTAPTGRRAKRAAKPKPAPEAEPEAQDEEVLTDEETPDKPKRDTTPLPTGEELYNAKYVDGNTWQEIRDNLDPRIRSPRGLAIIAAYVIENGLEDEHPEFSSLAELEGDELATAIVEAHDNGQGWAVLAARCDLKVGEVQDIYVDAGGENPGRVGGQRYGGGRSVGKDTPGEEGEEGEASEEDEPEPKPAAKRRPAKKPAAKPKPAPAPVADAAPAATKPAARRRRGAPTPS